MEKLPKDISGKILDELNPAELIRFCAMGKEKSIKDTLYPLIKLCDSNEFWERRFRKDFKYFLDFVPGMKEKISTNYKQYYLELFQIFNKYVTTIYDGVRDKVLVDLWDDLKNKYKEKMYTIIFKFLSDDIYKVLEFLYEQNRDVFANWDDIPSIIFNDAATLNKLLHLNKLIRPFGSLKVDNVTVSLENDINSYLRLLFAA